MKIRTQAGFTLVEMVIVISIISIVLAITYPSLQRTIEKYKFENAAREVVSDINFYRQKALAESSGDYVIKFYRGVNNKSFYRVEVRDGNIYKLVKTVPLPNNVIFYTSYVMSIGANGIPTMGTTLRIQQTVLKKAYIIAITVATGRVEMSSSVYLN
ncbi:MAG: pilus assembly FimT family protein [Bacillota bacterium]